jgi:GrpB-like predicted nucleotidyltransferase (UPF0157 family)
LRTKAFYVKSLPQPVIIVDYDPSWPKLYNKEKSIIFKAVGHRILAIEHIGSTAVPGLGAKNIIDMMAGVNGLSEANECLAFLDKIGYTEVTPEPDNPEWYYCLGKHSATIGYHLHLMKFNSDHWRRHLLFRDFLRDNPEVAKEYCNLKKKLAANYGTDREGYTEAKTAFITSAIKKANTRYVNK